MARLLLLGAGFSRNWGGWLANEVFEYLLGSPEIVDNQRVRNLLWKHHAGGGFEAALGELQDELYRNPKTVRRDLASFQAALTQMFTDMNRAFAQGLKWWAHEGRMAEVQRFLTRFDAIF